MSNNDKKLLKVFKNLTAKIDAISKEVEVVEAIKGDTGDKGDKGTQGATGHVGASGVDGKVGKVGSKGKDGSEGRTGASVPSAKIDIDGHLVLTLSDGTEIDAGELPKEEAERVINYMSGGGAPNPNIHDLPWHILEGEKKQIGDREQVAIHDVFDLEGDLVLEGSAQLVLTDPLEGGSEGGGTGAPGADGEQGIQGETGAQGVKGDDGDQGIQGETGADGTGATSALFYALGSGSANLGLALGTVPLATATFSDTGYTLTSNEITIGAALDGKRAFITWAVAGSGAANRVEIRSELQVDTVRVKGSSNYVSRNATQDQGGVQGSHMMTLSTGDVIRVQALRDGSTANLLADETHVSIQTLD